MDIGIYSLQVELMNIQSEERVVRQKYGKPHVEKYFITKEGMVKKGDSVKIMDFIEPDLVRARGFMLSSQTVILNNKKKLNNISPSLIENSKSLIIEKVIF